jgi:pimeloyl-ACP methyl ester carboxylesterase
MAAIMEAGFLPSSSPTKSGRVSANGIDYYYEIHGEGEPLLLLHGGLCSIDFFGPVLPLLAESRQVIAVDLPGHGRTTLGDRPIRLADIGDDVSVLLGRLGYGQVDALGYSFGGGVAFRLAAQHPELVRRLVLVSAGFASDGFYAEMLPQQAQMSGAMADTMKGTPMYQSYFSEDVKGLRMPVMLVYGDSDMFRPEHIVEFYKLLGGGLRDAGWMRENMSQNRLAVLPGLTHYETGAAPAMVRAVLPFLNGESGAASWSEQVERTA